MKRDGQQQLKQVPISWVAACAFITAHHRHHPAPRGQKWAVGAKAVGFSSLWGVATCGRPIAREYDDGTILEVNRTCTPGFPNVNSFLYGVSFRIAREMGYSIVITYTQEGESGVSLRAAGFQKVGERVARPGWADSSVKLKAKRNPDGPGGVKRFIWARAVIPWKDVLLRLGGEPA